MNRTAVETKEVQAPDRSATLPAAAGPNGDGLHSSAFSQSQDFISSLSRDVIHEAAVQIGGRPPITSTCRIQFNPEFTLHDYVKLELAEYHSKMGFGAVYSSPLWQAKRGSMHGYDVTHHDRIDEERGGEAGLRSMSAELKKEKIQLVLDIVPNHMYAGQENPWWQDVLENGQASPYAHFFDINWDLVDDGFKDKVLVPDLGNPLGVVIDNHELPIQYNLQKNGFSFGYYEKTYPISPRQYPLILRSSELEQNEGRGFRMLEFICRACENLPSPKDVKTNEEKRARSRDQNILKDELAELLKRDDAVRAYVDRRLAQVNGRSEELLEILNAQPYRLADWHLVDEINYRRFFDINSLAAICPEHPDVFEATHRMVFNLIDQGIVDGLRIDHPDGLAYPQRYFSQLQEEFLVGRCRKVFEERQATGAVPAELPFSMLEPAIRSFYTDHLKALRFDSLTVWAEKILNFGRGETLPSGWQVAGTTGYDILNVMNGLFIDSRSKERLIHIGTQFVGNHLPDFEERRHTSKELIIERAMKSELVTAAGLLHQIAQLRPHYRDFSRHRLQDLLKQYVVQFPAYRSYIGEGDPATNGTAYVISTINHLRNNRAAPAGVFDFLQDALLGKAPGNATPEERQLRIRFALAVERLTAPVEAQGTENTAFFSHHTPLAATNEVGGEPAIYGTPRREFHHRCRQRLERYLLDMTATETHDNKFGGETRLGINVLSEIPEQWQAESSQLSYIAKKHKTAVSGRLVPDRDEEYRFLQTLVGTFPMDLKIDEIYIDRIRSYMQKAIKEAKINTSWTIQNPEWEQGVDRFVEGTLRDPEFLDTLREFLVRGRVKEASMVHSLAQVTLKHTMPGVPDTYQGREGMWDLSLVDPDNRRPIDWEQLKRNVQEFEARTRTPGERAALIDELRAQPQDARIKHYTSMVLGNLRKQHPDLMLYGSYEPLTAVGDLEPNILAFQRVSLDEQTCAVTIAPRLVTNHLEEGIKFDRAYSGTDVILASPPGTKWMNVFTGTVFESKPHEKGSALCAGDLFRDYPIAVLMPLEEANQAK